MNCRNCNTEIDYNYITNCAQCGAEVEAGSLPKLDPSLKSTKRGRIWSYRLTNLLYLLSTAFIGMLSGACVMYATAGAIYVTLRSAEATPGAHCAEGAAVGLLSVLGGGFLGTIAGTALALKRPVLSKAADLRG